jgi:hypothetical protein
MHPFVLVSELTWMWAEFERCARLGKYPHRDGNYNFELYRRTENTPKN